MPISKRNRLHVVISLDVEEEGLFSGHYKSSSPGVTNVSLLPALKPLKEEFGLPPTLFCSHAVFSNADCLKILAWMQEHCSAEIGAHLHHWSTPPLDAQPRENATPTRTHLLARDLLSARLGNLLQAGVKFLGAPITSFRMGRWDLKSILLPMLIEYGIRVDSSICPLRAFPNGPDHFLAPPDPYWLDTGEGRLILEAPITQVPILPLFSRLWHRIMCKRRQHLDAFHFFGAMSANPCWHGARIMRMATRAHVARGGTTLSLFWHSSEMMPGGSPHIREKKDADRLLGRIFSFCGWLKNNYDVHGVTASELAGLGTTFATWQLSRCRDW